VRRRRLGPLALVGGAGALAFVVARAGLAAEPGGASPAEPAPSTTTLPTTAGNALAVRTAVQFVDVGDVDENEETFFATVDVRLRWTDRSAPKLSVRGADVDAALATIWSPGVELANLDGEPDHVRRGLTIDGGGHVELLERTTGTFTTTLDVREFPFDRQQLAVEVVVPEEDLDHVVLEFHGDDVAFSRVASGVELTGWEPGSVDLVSAPVPGWGGDAHARVIASVNVARQSTTVMAPVFIPLFSSMVIPLVAIWLQKVSDEGEFEIDAFELANIVIGGLFAVIALNFTINSEYSTLASGDNTVTRLFALNYLSLATAMAVNLGMFQFNLVERWFGRFVQEQLYHVLWWGLPVITLGTSVAVLLVAWA
jgi:hypothetical protein